MKIDATPLKILIGFCLALLGLVAATCLKLYGKNVVEPRLWEKNFLVRILIKKYLGNFIGVKKSLVTFKIFSFMFGSEMFSNSGKILFYSIFWCESTAYNDCIIGNGTSRHRTLNASSRGRCVHLSTFFLSKIFYFFKKKKKESQTFFIRRQKMTSNLLPYV